MSAAEGCRVVREIAGANRTHPTYPLLPGDLLVQQADGSWMKEAPGLAVGGFVLTPEEVADLQPVGFLRAGLAYTVLKGDGA